MINIEGLLARSSPMPTPFAPRIILSQNACTDLQTLARAHSTPQSLSLRARIILRAAETDTPTNLQIGRDLGCANHTVGKWRRRYLALGFSGLQDALRPGRPRTIASPTRVKVISVASALPQDQKRPVTRWTLDEIVATLLEALHTDAISRSSIWPILQDIDLKPHKSEYWLNSHDEHFEAKAHAICQLYVKALEAYEQGRLVICCDEKTGMQVLERKAPTKPAQYSPWHASPDQLFGGGHRADCLDAGDHAQGHRFRSPSQTGLPMFTPHATLRLGDGQLEHPLELGRLPLGGSVVYAPF
jgi:transposase